MEELHLKRIADVLASMGLSLCFGITISVTVMVMGGSDRICLASGAMSAAISFVVLGIYLK